MACACRKVQEKQERIIDLDKRIGASQNNVERAALSAQKAIAETDIGGNKIFRFIKKFFLLIIFQIPLALIMGTLVVITLIMYTIISTIAKTLFNKEIKGILSPLDTYNKIKDSALAQSVDHMKEKIGKFRNESK